MNPSAISPSDPAFVQNPYPGYEAMRAAGRAFRWDAYDLLCFPHFAEVDAILRDRRFGREPLEPREYPVHMAPFHAFEAHSMLELEPPRHTRLRGLVNRAFLTREVERLRPRMETLAHALIDDFGEEVDLIEAYATPIPVTMIAELLGTPVDMAEQMLSWSHDMVAMYQFRRDRAVEDAAVRATIDYSDFMRRHVEERRRRPTDDLLSKLIAAEEAGERLTTDELITTSILLMNAGHEATVHAIGNSVKALLEGGIDPLPALAEPASARRAVDELLRFDAPLHMFTRHLREDVEIAGLRLSRGDEVGLLLGAANRDPIRFTSPNDLDLARDQGGHASFGAGIHFCVGAPLARLEIEVAIGVLFGRLPHMRLTARPVYADRYHFHGLETLRVETGA